jgi:putative flavoprotein involved in K+ transport
MSTVPTDVAVVLERGRTAQRRRAQPWESLRLRTPHWMSRLPGWGCTGSDPAGFMTARQVAGHLGAAAPRDRVRSAA